ncbi:MAG: phosphate ABC transporter ATP-binding protein [Bacteroidales bacterium]|nr:phosphate ABC transporter ATP-binding protein [Bacteroidales bacterium]
MSKCKVEISHLNLHIGKQHILKDVSTCIPEKQITVILGPSGCGKTTLLKSMNRLTDLYSNVKVEGTIVIDGEDILHTDSDITMIRKRMGLLSQRPYPLPMNIFNNVAYGLKISGRKNKQVLRKRVQHYLELVNLWDEVKDRLHDPASSLSIGQQQRLCLARGLSVDPDIILADEPTSALDPISSEVVEKKFFDLKSQYTIIVVTHSLQQARRIADYAIFMYLGEIIEQGPADEFFSNPKQELTRSYIKGLFN